MLNEVTACLLHSVVDNTATKTIHLCCKRKAIIIIIIIIPVHYFARCTADLYAKRSVLPAQYADIYCSLHANLRRISKSISAFSSDVTHCCNRFTDLNLLLKAPQDLEPNLADTQPFFKIRETHESVIARVCNVVCNVVWFPCAF
jgi:hypothetical protein